MKAPQLFALAVRIAGLIFLYHALAHLPDAVFKAIDVIFGASLGKALWTIVKIVVLETWLFVMAWWLMTCPRVIMDIAYPGAPKDDQSPV
jgi:hypothetical protein